MLASDTPRIKPKLRGVLHHYAFLVSLLTGAVLVSLVPTGHAFAAAVYGASLSALLGVSALFHRVTWSVSARRWMARLDHAMICVLIAGTFTPFGIVALDEKLGPMLLAVIWTGATAGILLHLLWIDMPKWLSALVYVLLGWVGIAAAPQVVSHAGWTAFSLLLAGGLIYSAGALVYATRRPDPLPTVFGYHEVFHALVVVAAAAHYAAVAIAIL
ncbi:MAG TPA: hemolysin III family protein [Candidatus Binatia bacterium]|nr:hemolysin III family protein [Candidatus Binatia bacterium]